MRVAGSITRPSLADEHFHVLVIGGGINGAAIARELARAKRRVLLLEQHDFASGTTSRATRIIHGGLRYLEHAEIALVRESLRGRDRLLRERPHLVRPLRFVLAMRKHGFFSKRGTLAIRSGLQLYRWMSNEDSLPSSRTLELKLDRGEALSVFNYEDAQCEFPERLVAESLTEAAFSGARVRNHAKVLEIRKPGHHFTVLFRDWLRREDIRVFADAVINASGPWVNEVCARAFVSHRNLVQGIRGSHIIIDRFPDAPSHAIYTEATDGRPFFVLPWNSQILIGTTEVPDDRDPAQANASGPEIQYLIDGFNRLFKSHQISHADVLAHYSGIRSLPATDTYENLGAVTRRSFVHDHRHDGMPGMYSLIGGKLTTASSVARTCAKILGAESKDEPVAQVALGPASGFENTLQQWARQAARHCGITEASAQATAEWHGRCALPILRRAKIDSALAAPLADGTDHLLVECVHAFEREFAVTLADALLRRVPVALSAKWSFAQSRQAARSIGRALGWSEARVEKELEDFESEREGFLHPAGARTHRPVPAEHAA